VSAQPYGSWTAVIVYCGADESVVLGGTVNPTRISPLFRTRLLLMGPVGQVDPSTWSNSGSLPPLIRYRSCALAALSPKASLGWWQVAQLLPLVPRL